MRTLATIGTVIAVCVAAGAAYADKGKDKGGASASEIGPRKPGAETRSLLPIAIDATWAGKVMANAMGPGTPEMPSAGKGDCEWSIDGMWLSCEMEDTWKQGAKETTWKGQFTVGYDYFAKEYRATVVDNFGGSTILQGRVDGNKLVLTSILEVVVDGKRCKGRMTYDWSNPSAIKWTSENSTDGGPFKVVEEVIMKPTKKESMPSV